MLKPAHTSRHFFEIPESGSSYGGRFADSKTGKPGFWKDVKMGDEIIWPGGKLTEYEPLKRGTHIIESFVAIPQAKNSTLAALRFVNEFGLLFCSQPKKDEGEFVSEILNHARAMRELYDLSSRGKKEFAHAIQRGAYLGVDLRAILAPDPSARQLTLTLQPHNLLGAIAIKFGLLALGDAAFRVCEQCAEPFICGPGSDKRIDAKFCSEEHRYLHKSLARSRRNK